MNSSDHYDVICAGAGLSSFLCAALLANAGKKVLVIDEVDHAQPFYKSGVLFDPDYFPLAGCESQFALGKSLLELGFNLEDFPSDDVLIQVLAPRYRASFWRGFERTVEELQRELDTDHGRVLDFFKHIYNAGKEVSSFVENALTTGQTSDQETRRWKSFWGPFYASLDAKTPLWLRQVLSEEASIATDTIASAVLGSFSFSTPKNLGFEQTVRALSLFFQGTQHYRGGFGALKQRLREIIKANGGEVKTNAVVDSLVVDGKNIIGVLLSSYDGLCRGDHIVLTSRLKRLYSSLPEGVQDPSVLRSLDGVFVSHWRFTIAVTVREEVIPVGATSNMTWIGSEKYPYEEENYLRIQVFPAQEKGLSTILLTSLVPYRASSMEYSYLRRLGGKLLQALREIMPFLEKNIVSIVPDFRNSETELRAMYTFSGPGWVPENLYQYYVRGHRTAQDFWGLSWTTPHQNLYFAGRAIWPALGAYGEALTARKVYQDLVKK